LADGAEVEAGLLCVSVRSWNLVVPPVIDTGQVNPVLASVPEMPCQQPLP
jgi:hypothetical protein